MPQPRSVVPSPQLAFAACLALLAGGCVDSPTTPDWGAETSNLESLHTGSSLRDQIRTAIAVQDRNSTNLLNRSNVVGTAIGLDEEGQPVIDVLLSQGGGADLPDRIEGFRVRSRVTGFLTPRGDPRLRARPAPLGYSIGHPNAIPGTLGARVVDGDGNRFILSSNHVLANNNQASIGDPVLQPGAADGGEISEDVVGTLAAYEPITFSAGANNVMDAALAATDASQVGFATPESGGYGVPSSRIYGDEDGDGIFDDIASLLGLPVQKYGRTTGLTTGEITGVNATVTICYQTFFVWCVRSARFTDQLLISPGSFSAGGDSGALIVTNDDHRKPVGLLYAGDSGYTVANRIDLVLAHFGVTIDDGDGTPPPPPPPPPPPAGPGLHTLSDDFSGTSLRSDLWRTVGQPSRFVHDNRLEVTLAPNTLEEAYMQSTDGYDFTDSYAFVEVSSVAGGNAFTETTFLVGTEDLVQYVAIASYDDHLTAWYQWEEDDYVLIGNRIRLDMEEHRFWRMRESGGTIYFETSFDGQVWTTRWTTGHEFDSLADLHLALGVTTWENPSSAPTPAHFEGVSTTIPASPRDLTATATSSDAIDLAWTVRSVNEAGFRIERRQGASGAFSEVTTVGPGASTYTDAGLPPETTFQYRVRAFNSSGASAAPALAAATTQSRFVDLAVSAVDAPAAADLGEAVEVGVVLANLGDVDVEETVTITLRDERDGVVIGTRSVNGVSVGSTTARTFVWETDGATPGHRTLTAFHDFGDDVPANDQATVGISLREPPAGGSMHVGDLVDVSVRGFLSWTPRVSVEVHDDSHSTLTQATVQGEWRSGSSVVGTGSCATGANGRCTISSGWTSLRTTQRTFVVTAVTHSSLAYDPSNNHDASGEGNGSSITVRRP